MERLQEDYLESYKKAMLWNVFIFQHFNDGMVSFYLTVYFYKEYELHLALFPMNL